MSDYHLHSPDVETSAPAASDNNKQPTKQSPPIIPFGLDNNDMIVDEPKELSKLQQSALFVWLVLASICFGAVALALLLGMLMSPMAMDSGTEEAIKASEILFLVLLGILSLLVWNVIAMWEAFLVKRKQNYKLAFWLGWPPVLVLVTIPLLILCGGID